MHITHQKNEVEAREGSTDGVEHDSDGDGKSDSEHLVGYTEEGDLRTERKAHGREAEPTLGLELDKTHVHEDAVEDSAFDILN